MSSDLYGFSVKDASEKEVSLSNYEGKVLLIVNTASKCGFTPQYGELEELYKKYQSEGFEVLAFPCNQFGSQEPGSDEEIQNFCDLHFRTSFRIFSKVDVNGKKADPLFSYLSKEAKGLLGTQKIKWNFTKFLVDRKGEKIKRFAPNVKPLALEGDLKKLL